MLGRSAETTKWRSCRRITPSSPITRRRTPSSITATNWSSWRRGSTCLAMREATRLFTSVSVSALLNALEYRPGVLGGLQQTRHEQRLVVLDLDGPLLEVDQVLPQLRQARA